MSARYGALATPAHPLRLIKRTAWLVALLALAACGGGGGSGGGSDNGGTGTTPPPPPANEAPQASFTISSTTGTAPHTVSVNASDSTDPDGEIAAYDWDFGGTSGIGVTAQHTFDDAGDFVVTLTVTDDEGETASTSRTVTVSAPSGTVTLSGTVSVLNSSAVDADVNDRLTTTQDNNSFANAQPVLTPATLGGFSNVANQGESTGNLFSSGDPGDFYRVSLLGNELILLDIAEASADLDLRLWDSGQNLVDSSLGVTNTETIEVSAAGDYFIEVFPFSGASNYVLSVGQRSTTTSLIEREPVRLSDPAIPGELIVKHKPNTTALSRVQAKQSELRLKPSARNSRTANQAVGISASRPTLYQVDNMYERSSFPAGAKVSQPLLARWNTLMAIKALKQNSAIDYVEPNLLRQAHATPNDEFYPSQWHYPAIQLPSAWDTTTGSPNVIVAVVDTGVLVNHPDLRDKLVPGFDFISDASRAGDGDGLDDNPNDNGDRDLGGSSSFHGTHVAGTVGAESNNNIGVAGVAWQTSIMPLRALGQGGGSTFDIVQSVLFAAGLSNNSGTVPTQRADVINLSLGGTFSSQSEQNAYLEARNAGVILIASAGNESTDLPSYPAAYDGVVSVSATTISNDLAGYSNFGSTIDVAAPGGSTVTDRNGDGIGDGVISTMGDDSSAPVEFGYAVLNGTSMSAPHVAGVVALMKAVHPGLTPAEFDNALIAGDLTDDLGAPGRDNSFGHGLINAQKAVATAQLLANGQGSTPGPILAASGTVLNFGGFLESLDVTLQNIGGGTLTVNSVTADQPWVTITGPGGNGLGEYTLAVNRSGLADGAYQATVTVDSDANDLSISLLMQVSSLNQTADVGLQYIILVDENGDTVLPAVLVNATDGAYPFTINDVPAGRYRVIAGSDYDDDSFLCDAGEACGAYPSIDSPEFIAVSTDDNTLDFESGFRINLNPNALQSNGEQTQGYAINKATTEEANQ